jgi:Protein of unknown function (DUF2800)
MNTGDSRRALPSASMMHRLEKCSGSLALTNALREQHKLYWAPSPEAAAGTRIHGWLALKDNRESDAFKTAQSALDRSELNLAAYCSELADEIIEQWGFADLSFIEQRFFYRQGLWLRFSGQPDLVLVGDNKRALILDYKTGRLEAEPAADNMQLRTEVVLLKHKFPGLEEIDAAIIEPLVSWDSERVRYSGELFREAENQILDIVDRAQWEADKRTAGPWCRYCPARANCYEALQYIQSIPAFPALNKDKSDQAGESLAEFNKEQMIRELPRGEHGAELWRKLKFAKKLLKDIEDIYEKILETEPDALPGFILPKEGHRNRRVVYPRKLKAALAEYLTEDEIDGCAEYYLGKIKEVFGFKHRMSGKELDLNFELLIKDAVQTGHDKPFIRPLTKAERAAAAPAKLVDATDAFRQAS